MEQDNEQLEALAHELSSRYATDPRYREFVIRDPVRALIAVGVPTPLISRYLASIAFRRKVPPTNLPSSAAAGSTAFVQETHQLISGLTYSELDTNLAYVRVSSNHFTESVKPFLGNKHPIVMHNCSYNTVLLAKNNRFVCLYHQKSPQIFSEMVRQSGHFLRDEAT